MEKINFVERKLKGGKRDKRWREREKYGEQKGLFPNNPQSNSKNPYIRSFLSSFDVE